VHGSAGARSTVGGWPGRDGRRLPTVAAVTIAGLAAAAWFGPGGAAAATLAPRVATFEGMTCVTTERPGSPAAQATFACASPRGSSSSFAFEPGTTVCLAFARGRLLDRSHPDRPLRSVYLTPTVTGAFYPNGNTYSNPPPPCVSAAKVIASPTQLRKARRVGTIDAYATPSIPQADYASFRLLPCARANGVGVCVAFEPGPFANGTLVCHRGSGDALRVVGLVLPNGLVAGAWTAGCRAAHLAARLRLDAAAKRALATR